MISLKESTNTIYAGQHWAKRKEYKDCLAGHAAKFCKVNERITTWPVQIKYRFIFETRALDTLNCVYMAKCLEDTLRALQILPDDSPKYVALSILEVVKKDSSQAPSSDKKANKIQPKAAKEDWLEITIEPYEFKPSN